MPVFFFTLQPNKDDFGSDPFAILHAPTSASQSLSPASKSGAPPRPESPSPALPPKKAKQPPPRPAPPRPSAVSIHYNITYKKMMTEYLNLKIVLQGPSVTKNETGFGPSAGGFADFADFDNKV